MNATVIAALIAGVVTLIGVFVQLFRMNRSDKAQLGNIKESLKEKHTLGKAEKYHEIIKLLINTTDKGIIEKINTSRELLEKDIRLLAKDTDIQGLIKDFNRYQNSIKRADSSEESISSAIKSIENLAITTGALKEEVTALKKKNIQLISELDILNNNYESSLKENKVLKSQNDELVKLNEQLEKQKGLDDSKEQTYEESELEDDFTLEL